MAAVLRDGDRFRAGRHPAMVRQLDQAGRRHVLEFGGDGGTGGAELLQRGVVGVVGLQVDIGHLPGGAGQIGVQHHDLVAHGARGDREHAAELAAAEDAEGGSAAGSCGRTSG